MFSWMVPGLGMFNESYYIFSVGNVKPIWREQYPTMLEGVPLACQSTRSLHMTLPTAAAHSCNGWRSWHFPHQTAIGLCSNDLEQGQ